VLLRGSAVDASVKDLPEPLKWIGGIFIVAALLFGAVKGCQEVRKASNEADKARHEAEAAAAKVPQPQPQPKPKAPPQPPPPEPEPAVPVVPAGPAVDKVILVGQSVPGWERGQEIVLERVELLPNFRMRWHLTHINRSGKDISVYSVPGAFVVDDLGNKYKWLDDSITKGESEGTIVNGQRWKYWADFQRVEPAASTMTVTWSATGPPRMTVRLSAAKSDAPLLSGKVRLFSKNAVVAGVEAWVEVNGERKTDWAVGAKEVALELPPGTYQITIQSVYQKRKTQVFRRAVTVETDKTADVSVDP
jgi:hypothetical protein